MASPLRLLTPELFISVLIGALSSSLLYATGRIIYNVTLHPLAKFPGPKLAAMTRLYEFYYDFYLGGQYTTHIHELHRKYGPIVRVSPVEVHILDSDFYPKLYNFDNELDKKPSRMDNLQMCTSSDVHKIRRRAFDPFFSKPSIQKLEPLLKHLVGKLCSRIEEVRGKNSPINIALWFRAMTGDVISEYMLSQPYNLMDDPAKSEKFVIAFCSVFKVVIGIREIYWFHWLLDSLEKVPKWLQFAPSSEGMEFVKMWQDGLEPRMRTIVKKELKRNDEFTHPVLMEEYLKNPNVKTEEKSYEFIKSTVMLFVTAGLETVGAALSMATFHLLSNKAVFQKVREEVDSIWPADGNMPNWSSLEKLPYLTGVIRESMRLSVGVVSRLPRINHHRAIEYSEWVIPPGFVVSMNQWDLLWDPEVFPEPKQFRPERWMDGEKSKDLEKNFVPFSKGSRNCIGEKLAWAEMYLTLANIVHRFDMELYETDSKDVYPKNDCFVPFPEREGNGVRVVVK